ncbi:MAG: LysM peptidoglycan-binding domain-containing protein [Bdellovibrionaceae bacterium]|nr:LysM peptidoglycan-binding domain-containing protein [Pseudobdellovibrionaceae bacterium]MDW8190237.1 LysM peptidoglycan-binding domain-containing protein [Pseudobdellovibrionaceae bacterium]
MVLRFLLSIILVSGAMAAQSAYDITPVPSDTWKTVLEKTPSRHYQVQKGDTLWEISRVFFGDPEYWPKLWAVNRDILFNPHQIYPGDVLVFDEGSLERPPSVRIIREGQELQATVTKNDSEKRGEEVTNSKEEGKQSSVEVTTPPNANVTPSSSTNTPSPNILIEEEQGRLDGNRSPPPEETIIIKPIEDYLKDKLPQPEVVDLNQIPVDFSTLKFPPKRVYPTPEPIPSSFHFIDFTPPSQIPKALKVGSRLVDQAYIQKYRLDCWIDRSLIPKNTKTIIKVEGGMNAAHTGQYVYIQGNDIIEGERYQVLSQEVIIIQKEESKKKENLYLTQYLGQVEVLKRVSNSKPIFRAIVTDAMFPLLVGSDLSSLVLTEIDINLREDIKNVRKDVVAQIYTGYCERKRHIFGNFEVIFMRILNGTPEVGNFIPIYRNALSDLYPLRVEQSHRLVGVAQIIKVDSDWATAIVRDSLEEIYTGDVTSEDLSLYPKTNIEFEWIRKTLR